MSQLLTDLRAGRALLTPPERWVKGYFAFSTTEPDDDHMTDATAPDAMCWCSYGATLKVTGEHGDRQTAVVDALVEQLPSAAPVGKDPLVWFNDHPDTTHADVLALWDRAIVAEEARVNGRLFPRRKPGGTTWEIAQ